MTTTKTFSPEAGFTAAKLLFKSALLLFFVCLIDTSTTQAQQGPPDELATKSIEELMNIEVASVFSASKYTQKVTDAPSSVSIVTADEIAKFGFRSLAEILRSVRGFYGTNDRNYSYLGVRGFARPGDYNTRILLLVDGHRINDNVYNLALIGNELPVEIDLIERVEVIRGPSSSIYGTNAFFAVVNVITKKGRNINGLETSGEIASFGGYKGRVSYGQTFKNGVELLVSGSYFDSKGPARLYFKEFDTPGTNNGVFENGDDESHGNVFMTLSVRDFTVRGVFGSREKGIPTGAFETVFNDRRTRTIDNRGYLNVQYEHTFKNRLSMMARASFDSYHYEGTYVFDYSTPGEPYIAINKDYSKGDWWSGEVQLSRTVARKHKLTFGMEFRDNLRQNQTNFNLGSTDVWEDRRQSRNAGVYLQDDFAISENLTFSAGMRYDYHTNFGGTTKPRLGLIYHPTPKSTLKLLYGEAFRIPNNYELYYYGNNFGLKRETITTKELVWEQYLGDHVRLSASAYSYGIKGLISQQTDPVSGELTFRNVEDIRSKGLEVEVETRLRNGVEARVGYTVQNTHEQFTRQPLTNSPTHLGKLNLAFPLFERRLFAALDLQYTSRRRTLAGSHADALWLPNVTFLSRNLFKQLDVSLGVYNLFNQTYGDPGAEEHVQNTIPQNGRNYRLKATYRF